ncbi:MAG: winged helix-turn-helix domain-containing protein [Terriglobales bacterium]
MDAAFRVGSWLVEPGLNTVSFNGTSTRLEPKVMEVLLCLASQPGEPVSKDAILKKVWPDTFVSEDVLTRSISELRRVFVDDAREPRVIQTIPKRGYRLVAQVEVVNGLAPRQLDSARSFENNHRGAKIAAGISGTALLVLALLLAFDAGGLRSWLWPHKTRPAIHSLAVLPLESLSTDPSQEFFAEGMTDALITDLAQISALKVVSRTTIMRYGRPDKPLPQIARELNVDGIVEGTVQRSGDRVRVSAQLIYGPADQHLWASTFEREVKDVFDLQNALASEIATQIRVSVTPEEQAKLKSLRPVNPKALDAYLEARFHIEQVNKLAYCKDKSPTIRQEMAKAVFYLDRSLQNDPNYLPAYVAYYDVTDAADIPHLDYLPKAKAALTKALELDETNEAARLALARVLMQYEYDWAGAERQYKRAIELNPNSADAHDQYADYLDNVEGGLVNNADNNDARRERELAQSLNPAHDYQADAGQQRVGRTLEEQRQAVEEKAPNDPFSLGVMGKNYAIAGRFKESVEMYERCLTLYGWHDFANLLRRADARGGSRYALEEWMRAGEEYAKSHDDLPLLAMAFTYSSLGNKDRAFVWLDKAVEQRHWMIIYLKRDKVWDPLRSDPRFKALLRRVGLSD